MAKRKQQPEFDYPKVFDQLMFDHFGEEFETQWNALIDPYGGWTTARKNGRKMTTMHKRVGRTISAAIAARRSGGL
jgi:hypothetical protein